MVISSAFEEPLIGDQVEEEKKKMIKSGGRGGCGSGGVAVLMEFNKGRYGHHEKDDNTSKSPDAKDIAIIKEESLLSTVERSSMEINLNDSFFIQKTQEDQSIRSAKAKMGEIREENEKLKTLLSQIVKDYQSLQMHFFDILKQGDDQSEKPTININTVPTQEVDEEPHELISLSLGRTSSSEPKKDEKKRSDINLNSGKEDEEMKGGFGLGLDCKLELSSSELVKNSSSQENSFEDLKEEDATELWPPSKVLKTMRNGDDQEVSQKTPLKKTRVSVRARCDAPTMNDGCQWRKYGQKIAKGNPCPRAYYRCTVSSNCPVRKQVQRCADDMSVLITTYEGTHNHPLPISATAMASTTSAAASMLQSQSSTSQPGLGGSVAAPIFSSSSTATNTTSLQGLNFSLCQNTRSPYNFYFPSSSISNSNLHPTITLDLTAPATLPSSLYNRFSYNAPRSSPTSLTFSSSSSPISSLDPNNTLQTSWRTTSGYSNYGMLSYNRNQYNVGSLNLGRQPLQEQTTVYQPNYMPMNNQQASSQQELTETIAAATKVITSNPNFRSALVAALTSFAGKNDGGGADGAKENHGGL